MDVFENEAEIADFYQGDRIVLSKMSQLKLPFYVAIDTKDLINSLDLKKEIVMTMLN